MKVLFICRSNAERSQVAEALFNSLSKSHKASSAGVNVENESSQGFPPGRIVTELMLGMWHDVIRVKRKQLSERMVKKADRVVVLLSRKDINELLPDYVRHSRKTVYWELNFRPPKSIYASFPPHTYKHHIVMVSRLQNKIRKLVKELDG